MVRSSKWSGLIQNLSRHFLLNCRFQDVVISKDDQTPPWHNQRSNKLFDIPLIMILISSILNFLWITRFFFCLFVQNPIKSLFYINVCEYFLSCAVYKCKWWHKSIYRFFFLSVPSFFFSRGYTLFCLLNELLFHNDTYFPRFSLFLSFIFIAKNVYSGIDCYWQINKQSNKQTIESNKCKEQKYLCFLIYC